MADVTMLNGNYTPRGAICHPPISGLRRRLLMRFPPSPRLNSRSGMGGLEKGAVKRSCNDIIRGTSLEFNCQPHVKPRNKRDSTP